ncbi:MAG: asparagine synthase-related protein [Candidatus Woesearchaeota archaeon]|nr:asparagine synthase-related protein [Candidatus Woesearchaeota archaeon]
MFEHLRPQLEGKPFLTNKEEIIAHLKILLKKAIQSKEKVGIAFSGGLDSSVLALLAPNCQLYTVGLENSSDVAWSIEVAQKIKKPITTKIISLVEAERIIKAVVHILQSTDVTHVGIGCVVYAVLEMAKKDNIKVVYGGLGAEEIFGGYKRHIEYGKDLENIHEKLWEGLYGMEERDLARDLPIAQHFGIKLVAPFLNEELVTYAMQIDPTLKINNERRKIILQDTAFALGLPKVVAYRKKMAAQYSSKFDRALERLAKKKGFSLKKEYLKTILKK